jgi:hypothetical protein
MPRAGEHGQPGVDRNTLQHEPSVALLLNQRRADPVRNRNRHAEFAIITVASEAPQTSYFDKSRALSCHP